jgi:hypothetical protein
MPPRTVEERHALPPVLEALSMDWMGLAQIVRAGSVLTRCPRRQARCNRSPKRMSAGKGVREKVRVSFRNCTTRNRTARHSPLQPILKAARLCEEFTRHHRHDRVPNRLFRTYGKTPALNCRCGRPRTVSVRPDRAPRLWCSQGREGARENTAPGDGAAGTQGCEGHRYRWRGTPGICDR